MFNNVYFQHTEDIINTSFSVQRPWRPLQPLVQPPVNLLKIADSISSWYIDREKEAAYYYLLSTDGSFLLYSGLLFLVDAVDLFSLNSDAAAAVPLLDDASHSIYVGQEFSAK